MMVDNPKDVRSYAPDHVVGILWGLVAFARTINYLETYWSSWQRSLARSSTMIFEWMSMSGAWWSITNILLVCALSLWAARGLSYSRQWSFVVAGYLCAVHVTTQLGRSPSKLFMVQYGVPVYLALFVYCGLRGLGVLGPVATHGE